GILRLSAAAAPTAGRMTGTKVGPLAQVRFADDNCARIAQLLCDKRVLQRYRSAERQRTGRRRHPIVRIDVVLDEHGNAVQGSAQPSGFALAIKSVSDGQRVWVQFDD